MLFVEKLLLGKYTCASWYNTFIHFKVGATCVGGIWRPVELPECLPGIHPRWVLGFKFYLDFCNASEDACKKSLHICQYSTVVEYCTRLF